MENRSSPLAYVPYEKICGVLRVLIKCFVFQDIWGVLLGGFLGHAICTGLAVIGGRMIAQRISVRTGLL